MSNLLSFAKKQDAPHPEQPKAVLSIWARIRRIIGVTVTWLYRLRGIFLAIPVVYAAIEIARYNWTNLPQVVGINLQASGAFADTITRELAVYGPFGLTCACLLLMLCSRKVMYPWAISILTLILPFLLLFSNRYPC